MITIGINGFGRIGRNFLRAAWGRTDMRIAAVNDLTDGATLAHLLKHDSILGAFPHEVVASPAGAAGAQSGGAGSQAPGSQAAGSLLIDGKPVRVFAEKDPARIPWAEAGVDVVIESTGRFTDRASAELHLGPNGAKRVIVSAPAKGDDLTVVMGVNDGRYDPAAHRVLSNGSCTTNALAPVALVLNEAFGIEHGLMNTTHAYTNSQVLHDQSEKDLRGARAAALSIVPYSSGAAKAIGKVIPALDGKLTGYSLRVPVPVVSIVDLTVNLSRDVTAEEVNAAFKAASEGSLRGILGYSEEPLVSSDYQGDPRSSIVDARSTVVIGKRMVKVLSWYDNEWGFSNRLVDLAALIGRKGV